MLQQAGSSTTVFTLGYKELLPSLSKASTRTLDKNNLNNTSVF